MNILVNVVFVGFLAMFLVEYKAGEFTNFEATELIFLASALWVLIRLEIRTRKNAI